MECMRRSSASSVIRVEIKTRDSTTHSRWLNQETDHTRHRWDRGSTGSPHVAAGTQKENRLPVSSKACGQPIPRCLPKKKDIRIGTKTWTHMYP